MPRLFASASTQFLSRSSSPITATPLTICGWYNPTTSASFQVLASFGNSSSANNWFLIAINSSGKPYCETSNSTATNATHGTSVVNGVWGHILGVFTSPTSRTIYFNGINPVSDTTSKTPTGINSTDIGRVNSGGTSTALLNGIAAHIGAWSTNLNTDEITALASGVSPLYIRPGNLIEYVPIWNQSPETDMLSNTGLTVTGATNSTNIPPVSMIHGYRGSQIRPAAFKPGLAR